MRLLQLDAENNLMLTEDLPKAPGAYAILSHTWGAKEQELTFSDFDEGTGKVKKGHHKDGHKKTLFCATQARAHGLEYCWVDTCCINKSSSAELSEAIVSMYRWYQRAARCYVYLTDVSTISGDDVLREHEWQSQFRGSRWFTFGWTLQEMIAPTVVDFYSREQVWLGDKTTLELEIHRITDVPVEAIRGNVHEFDIEQRLSWASRRRTTREEDAVYCLCGLVDVFMQPLYGEEGHRAYNRLQQEIKGSVARRTQAEDVSTREAESLTSSDARGHGYPANSCHSNAAQEEKDFQALLKSLSYLEIDYRRHAVDDAQDDTCKWLLDHEHYHTWKLEASTPNILMVCGKPGSGKSTAMKRAYSVARNEACFNEVVVAFFFNARGVPMEIKLEGFFRSAIHQMLQGSKLIRAELLKTWKSKSSSTRSGWEWTVKELQEMFWSCMLSSGVNITMFVDALDECESTLAACNIMDLLSRLKEFRDIGEYRSRLKICVSRRHYPNVGTSQPLQIVVEEVNESDIMKYVDISLHTQDGEFRALARRITARSQGIFLWACLAIQRVKEGRQDGEPPNRLEEIVDHVPQRLEELFQALVNSIPPKERERCKLMIWWVLYAKRPLPLRDFCDALGFRRKYPTYQQYRDSGDLIRPAEMRKLLATSTRGLLEAVRIGKSNHTGSHVQGSDHVQFIHESVREYILRQQTAAAHSSTSIWREIGAANNALALSCLNYIRAVCLDACAIDSVLDKLNVRHYMTFMERIGDWSFLEYAIRFGFEHAELAEVHHFPQSHIFENTAGASRATADLSWWDSFIRMFRQIHAVQSWRHANRFHWSSFITTPLAFACGFNLDSQVSGLITRHLTSMTQQDLSRALCVTVTTGNEKSLLLLLQAGADVDYNEASFESPLDLSLRYKRDGFVPILLEHGAKIHKGDRERSPIVAATLCASLDTLHVLLSHGAAVAECESAKPNKSSSMDALGTHPLEVAGYRDVAFMETILTAAERQGLPFRYYMTAHLWAISSRNAQYAKLLESTIARKFHGRRPISFSVSTSAFSTGRRIHIDMYAEALIVDLKRLIEILERHSWDGNDIVLSNGSRILRDDRTLSDYKVQGDDTIHVLLKMRWTSMPGG